MNVLLINDCRFESIILKDILNCLGYSTEITSEYNVFIDIDRHEPDIVIANLIMRDTRGDELIRDIKRKHPNIKCVLSSSSINELDYVDSGVDGIVTTPVNKENMKKVLDSLFDSKTEKSTSQSILDNLMKKSSIKSKDVVTKTKQDMELIKFCPYCGEELGEKFKGVKFCPYCGKKISI